MIDEADRDGDGEVNEQEFLRIMKKTSLYWNWILFIFAHVRMCLVGASFFFFPAFCFFWETRKVGQYFFLSGWS